MVTRSLASNFPKLALVKGVPLPPIAILNRFDVFSNVELEREPYIHTFKIFIYN